MSTEDALAIEGFKTGQNYRVIIKGYGTTKPRELVASYLGYNYDLERFSFNLRPLAGTQDIPKRDIQAIYECGPGTEKMLPRIYRAIEEKRVF